VYGTTHCYGNVKLTVADFLLSCCQNSAGNEYLATLVLLGPAIAGLYCGKLIADAYRSSKIIYNHKRAECESDNKTDGKTSEETATKFRLEIQLFLLYLTLRVLNIVR